MKRVAFGNFDKNKKNTVFLAIYIKEISLWKYFNGDIKNMKYPAIIMIDRWGRRKGHKLFYNLVSKGEPSPQLYSEVAHKPYC